MCLREAGQLHHNRQPCGEERDIRESKEARVAGFFKMERERERKLMLKYFRKAVPPSWGWSCPPGCGPTFLGIVLPF